VPTTTPELPELWDRFRTDADTDARDQLILHYAPLVKFVAGRVGSGLPSSVEQSDLVSYGILGLIDALSKFDPDRGFKFETYAISRIKGSMIDELRATDWVPRSVRTKARSLEEAMAGFQAREHRPPTDTELAGELGVPEEQLRTMLGQVSFTGLVALDDLLGHGRDDGGGSATVADTITDRGPGPLAAYEVTELREHLNASIRALPERERTVVGLYYFEGLTLAEIGSILGVTESRVCQIHTKAVLSLRAHLVAAGRGPGTA
jgi:RNA polymerase sigma factor for flagellar operon FliA